MSLPSLDVEWIETAAELRDLVRHLREAGRFAFDTEFVSEETYEPVLCLIQVATAERLAVVDPQTVGSLADFWELLLAPGVEVVLHAAGEDLRIARLRLGRLPERVVDVQVAAGLAGYGYPTSLGNLVRGELGVPLANSETRTDWRRRPLSEAQVEYAADDVRYLLAIADRLHGRIAERGRTEWVEAEYRRLVEQITLRADEDDRWRRLPGLHQLSRRGLEAARRLHDWRDELARKQNRPFRQVLRDDLLVGIARRMPKTQRDLEALRDFNRPHLTARSRELLDVVAGAAAVAEADLPQSPERREEPPGLAMVVSLLNATLNQCCAENGVSQALVGSNGDLKDLVAWHLAGRPDETRPGLARGWRNALCGQILGEVLAGERSLRIVDPGAENPVAIDAIPE